VQQSPPDAGATQPTTNLTDGCVENYDPSINYFPQQASLQYAENWTIEYHNHYKVVRVLTPWSGAETSFEYVLLQCGTPAPEGYDDTQIIEVPARSIVSMTTAYLPHLDDLGLLDRLVGVDSFGFVYTPEVIDMIEGGEIAEVGGGANLNVERVLELDPGVVMTYGVGDAQSDTYPQLLAAGVPTILNAEYMESSPLGRAEWIKFTAALFNHEATAAAAFTDIAAQYNTLAASVGDLAERPTVFTSVPFQGTWYMPGGNSYQAQLLADAGADYLWAADDSTGSLELSFEAVYDRAADAAYWINTGTWSSLEDARAADERFTEFAAFQQGNLYNNTGRTTPSGSNDYWERGMANPHLLLADLIAIFHPDILPEHELLYYEHLQ
jgi:iron complex transport system substrate-binding protein